LPHASEVDDFISDLAMFLPVSLVDAVEAFPATEALPQDRVVFDEMDGIRQRVLKRLAEPSPPRVVVASIQSLLQCVPTKDEMIASTRVLRVNEDLEMTALTAWLVSAGFRNTAAVEMPGEFSIRG